MLKVLPILLLIANASIGQNLVPNPSFEDTIGCPQFNSGIYYSSGWMGYGQSPDYFNSCSHGDVGVPSNQFGNQYAASGNAYSGIYAYTSGFAKDYSREMLGRELSKPLIKGHKYFVSMDVSLGDVFKLGSNNLGISFSTVSLTNWYTNSFVNKNRPFVYSKTAIKDYTNWVNIRGSFIADSNYKYIIIGNFLIYDSLKTENSNAPSAYDNSAYYFIDDVCVSEDSLTCVSKVGITSIEQLKEERFVIYPNPFNDNITIKGREMGNKEVLIFDVLSKEMVRQKFSGNITLDLQHLSKGIYYYEIKNEIGVVERGKIVKE